MSACTSVLFSSAQLVPVLVQTDLHLNTNGVAVRSVRKCAQLTVAAEQDVPGRMLRTLTDRCKRQAGRGTVWKSRSEFEIAVWKTG